MVPEHPQRVLESQRFDVGTKFRASAFKTRADTVRERPVGHWRHEVTYLNRRSV